jgi:hypothetical protein
MSHPLYLLLQQLETANIPFVLSRNRHDTVLVTLTVVGERIEIDVFEDGHMEVSKVATDALQRAGHLQRWMA